jgi:hypothetical protein
MYKGYSGSIFQNQTTFKRLKVKHYLRILDDSGLPPQMLEHISEFFQSLVRRNLSMGSLVQYFHALKRFLIENESALNMEDVFMVKADNSCATKSGHFYLSLT